MTEAGPELTVLCTSRQPLGFAGRWSSRRAAGPASSDDPAGLRQAPTVRLFYDQAAAAARARARRRAARTSWHRSADDWTASPWQSGCTQHLARSIGLRDLLAHLAPRRRCLSMPLRDHPRPAPSMTTIAWSLRPAPPGSRALFVACRCSRSPWTGLEAAGLCLADDQSRQSVLGVLADLVDRSMIVAEFRRPRGLPHAIDVAWSWAARSGWRSPSRTAERRARHARFYADLAAAASRACTVRKPLGSPADHRLQQPACVPSVGDQERRRRPRHPAARCPVELRAADAVGRVLPMGRGGV